MCGKVPSDIAMAEVIYWPDEIHQTIKEVAGSADPPYSKSISLRDNACLPISSRYR